MWVNFWIYEGFSSTQVGAGGFLFDSNYFVADEGAPFGYSGLVSADELENAGVDFFAGALAGTRWDISDVHLMWWDGYFTPDLGGLNLRGRDSTSTSDSARSLELTENEPMVFLHSLEDLPSDHPASKVFFHASIVSRSRRGEMGRWWMKWWYRRALLR